LVASCLSSYWRVSRTWTEERQRICFSPLKTNCECLVIMAAETSEVPRVERQGCVLPLQRNVFARVPARASGEMDKKSRTIFRIGREKTALTPAEDFVELYRRGLPKSISYLEHAWVIPFPHRQSCIAMRHPATNGSACANG
jgi:hypothetical protein